jgi:hypothetical protein
MRLTRQANARLIAFGGERKCGDGFVGAGFGFSL